MGYLKTSFCAHLKHFGWPPFFSQHCIHTDEAGRPLLANECLQSHVDGEHTVTYHLHLNQVRSLPLQDASFSIQNMSMYVSAWEFP